MPPTRRSFLQAAGVGGLTVPPAAPLTAQAVIDRIRSRAGIPWMSETVDRVVARRSDAVRGVATTMMATSRAVAARGGGPPPRGHARPDVLVARGPGRGDRQRRHLSAQACFIAADEPIL